jgi:methylmalonyl-CoA mutase
MIKPDLFSEFAPTSKVDWLKRIEKDLKGRPISELSWNLPFSSLSDSSISIDSLAHADDFAELPESLALKTTNNWDIGEDIEVTASDIKAANKQALTALMGGANAINFIVDTYPAEKELLILLQEIELEYIAVYFTEKTSQQNPLPFLKCFHQVAVNWGKNTNILRGGVAYSPMSSTTEEISEIRDIIKWVSQNLAQFKVLTINALPYFDGSENVIQELTYTLEAGNEFIRKLRTNRLDSIALNKYMQFKLSIGISYFVEIAKLRAFKLLWGNVLDAYNRDKQFSEPLVLSPSVQAYVSPNTQMEDVHTNKIRATTQAMSAVLGGVDMLTISPSDAVQGGESSDFSRRIARNVQHLLQMESYLDKVVDPSAGSFYIEKLTQQIAEAVWKRFQNQGN